MVDTWWGSGVVRWLWWTGSEVVGEVVECSGVVTTDGCWWSCVVRWLWW